MPFLILVLFLVVLIGFVIGFIFKMGYGSKIHTSITFNEPEKWKKSIFGGVVTYSHPTDLNTFIQFIPESEKEENFIIDNWKETIKIDSENCDKLIVVKINNFTINNLQASEYISECKIGRKILMTRYVTIVKADKFALFTLATTKKEYDKNNAIFNKLLESIVWK